MVVNYMMQDNIPRRGNPLTRLFEILEISLELIIETTICIH